eukprot:3171857-Pleurochrysis_carterae.AAC.1
MTPTTWSVIASFNSSWAAFGQRTKLRGTTLKHSYQLVYQSKTQACAPYGQALPTSYNKTQCTHLGQRLLLPSILSIMHDNEEAPLARAASLRYAS